MTASGITSDGTWTPAFKGQRPPFSHGNKTAQRHGAHDLSVVMPVAGQVIAEVLAAGLPPWAGHELLRPTLHAYAIQEARARILFDYLDVIHLPFCPCESCRSEDEQTRQARQRRRNAAWEAEKRASTRAHYLYRDLGGSVPDWGTPPPHALWVKAAQDMGYNIRRRPPGRPPKSLTGTRPAVTWPPSPRTTVTSPVTH